MYIEYLNFADRTQYAEELCECTQASLNAASSVHIVMVDIHNVVIAAYLLLYGPYALSSQLCCSTCHQCADIAAGVPVSIKVHLRGMCRCRCRNVRITDHLLPKLDLWQVHCIRTATVYNFHCKPAENISCMYPSGRITTKITACRNSYP